MTVKRCEDCRHFRPAEDFPEDPSFRIEFARCAVVAHPAHRDRFLISGNDRKAMCHCDTARKEWFSETTAWCGPEGSLFEQRTAADEQTFEFCDD